MKIAWIGTGVMGTAMLRHLKDGGHDIACYNRTYEKAKHLETEGIQVCESIEACVQDAQVIFTMLGYPKDVEEVYTADYGIFKHASKGAILIDMTTSSPSLAKELYTKAKMYEMDALDAPVSGGDSGAKNATLSIMAGGDKAVFDSMRPLFSLMGTSLNYMGEAGNGQHTKAANQIAVAGAVAAMSEAIFYAQSNGVDCTSMLHAIKGGAAGSWQINNTALRVLEHDYQPGFYIKHFIKDMHIVQDVMSEQHCTLEMLNTVCRMYERLVQDGYEDLGTQALVDYYAHK